jgi:hypothetical protein
MVFCTGGRRPVVAIGSNWIIANQRFTPVVLMISLLNVLGYTMAFAKSVQSTGGYRPPFSNSRNAVSFSSVAAMCIGNPDCSPLLTQPCPQLGW